MATPQLDVNHLCDIIDITIQYRDSNVKLAAFYINFHCSTDDEKIHAGTVQRDALRCYNATQQALAECQVLRHIVYPLKPCVGAAFISRVSCNGNAEVLLMGAALHARDLCNDKMATVAFVTMTQELFTKRYIEQFEVPAVTTTTLQM
jgi:hypothetical protein